MINPLVWHRTMRHAFTPTEHPSLIYCPRQLNLEAQAYCDYLKTRLILTPWDKYPVFFAKDQVSTKCIDAYHERLRWCEELEPTVDQQLVQTQ